MASTNPELAQAPLQGETPVYKRILLGFLAVGVTLGGIEAAARIRQYVKYGTSANTIYSTATSVDTASGLIVPRSGYRTRSIVINSRGFRSPELITPKPPGTIRLAFLGGSTTFCAEVSSNEATWPHLVWKALQDRWPNVRFDYVNASFVGYTARESLRNLQYRVAPLQPDIIVIHEGINDLSKDTRELAKKEGLFTAKTVESDGFLSRWSLACYLIVTKIKMVSRERNAVQNARRLKFDPLHLSDGFHGRLKNLVENARAVAPVTAVATTSQWARPEQPRAEQARALQSLFFYNPYMSVDGFLSGVAEYNRVVRMVSGETGTILIGDENAIPGDDQHFIDSVHFKDAGSKLMAERVVAALMTAAPFKALLATSGSHESTVPQVQAAHGR